MCTCDPNCSGCKTPHPPKLRIKLVKFEKALAVQVLKMDERFRCTNDDEPNSFTASNGFEVRSDYATELERKRIGLRGSAAHRDLDIEITHFESDAERDAYAETLIAALAQWANDWEGFADPHRYALASHNGAGIYTF